MSTVVDPFIKRLRDIELALPRVANRILLENAEYVLSLLKDNQLSLGLNSNHKIVGRYSKETQRIYYDQMNKSNGKAVRKPKIAGSPYNFDWTGELFETLNVKGNVPRKSFDFFSASGKLELLEREYNTKLGELSEQNNYILNTELLIPKLQEYILEESVRGLI